MSKSRQVKTVPPDTVNYTPVLQGVVALLEQARRTSARALNAILTATYWEIGRRIVQFEQAGKERANYGSKLLEQLALDLTAKFGRGFSKRNLEQMRLFYLGWPIAQTLSAQLVGDSKIAVTQTLEHLAANFPLPWSHYLQLLKVEKPEARAFYSDEALRNGWSVRQLERQITTLFFERTLSSRHQAAMLKRGEKPKPGEMLTPEEEIKDPLVLEFLGLKDEYSESDLEEALIRELETFLLELGSDFAFVGRQKRLRIGDEWYRIDLLFYHRRLRSLVIVDLKLGKFTPTDAGQMHMYLNYAQAHWTNADENPPVGLILCTRSDTSAVHYALENLPNKVLAAEYRTKLPNEKLLAEELETKRRLLEKRAKAAKLE